MSFPEWSHLCCEVLRGTGLLLTSAKDDHALLIEGVLSSFRIEASGRCLSIQISITKNYEIVLF